VKAQVFRSRAAWLLGWVWVAFAAFNAVDLVVRGRLPSALVAGAVLGVLTAIIFVTCLRPGILLRDEGVLVRNPLRDAFVPWKAVDDVRVSHAIIIDSGDGRVRCWSPQASARERAKAVRRGTPAVSSRRGRWPSSQAAMSKAEQAAAEAFAGRTHADWVAQQITETARSRSRNVADGGPLTVTWSRVALGVMAAAAALVIAAIVASL
jgi:hypothetical protein